MRMKDVFEAYIDDYDHLNIYMSKNFFNGQSRIFHLKDSKDQIIPLRIVSQSDLYNGYTHYELFIQGDLEIGEEYTVYDEHCQTTICQYGHIVKTQRFNLNYEYDNDDLGLSYSKERSIFKLWSPVAHEIRLRLWKEAECFSYEMTRKEKGIFSITIPKDLSGFHYTFLVHVNGKWNEIVDPYTSWSGPNGKYSEIVDVTKLKKIPRISLTPLDNNTDAIIYEASIRDMTSQAGIGVTNPKTFLGFVEENYQTQIRNTGFTYIKSLGVTHIQLMPVFDFGSVDEIYPGIFYNWGYDPVQYRCLEGYYSTDPKDPCSRVLEFATMVKKCHEAGIRVNLDLVFNHVYNKEHFSLEQLVPNYYFLMNQNGEFSNGSFCGNDIDTQQPMSRRYFVDTCKRIVEWFDIDGFRFDLMGILDINLMNEISQVCKSIKPDFMIYGEGWNMPSFVNEQLRASQFNQHKMKDVGHFSDRFREAIRGSNGELQRKGYASGKVDMIEEVMHCMAASCLDHRFDSPQKVINYVECHDNHTLWDKNRVCCHGESRDIREKRQTLANAMVLLAQGVPFLHAGQEFGRTKQNLGNTYNRSDNYNRIDYTRRDHHSSIYLETKTLIQIRKQHACFRLKSTEEIEKQVQFSTIEHCVLVYECRNDHEKCMVFFNPTERYFTYTLPQEMELLFDNGKCNPSYTSQITIAPYSVVVCCKFNH